MSFTVHIGSSARPRRLFINTVDFLSRRKFIRHAGNAFSARGPFFHLLAQSVCAYIRRRRAIAQLSQMDQHQLKDLGFPTRSQVECRSLWSW